MLSKNILKLFEIYFQDLEFSVLKLSEVLEDNKSFRIDSEYFKREYLENINTILNYKNGYVKFKTIIKKLTGGATPLGANYLQDGVPFIRVQNVMQNYFNLSDIVYISKEDDEEIKRSRLKLNDILLTITGSYGKSATVTSELVNSNINQHSVKIEINDTYKPFFISTFLNSKIGKLQSDRNVIGISRPALDYSSIKNFLIPIVSQTFQLKIETLVKSAHQKLEESKTLYKEAEELLLKELDLLDFEPTDENIAIKSFRESFLETGRLDSEYYQPKYDEILEKIRNYRGGWDYIKNEFIHIKTTFKKDKEYYNYLEIGDINISDGNYSYNKIHKNYLPANAKIKVQKNDIVISKVRPNRGAVSIIKDNDLIVSGAFTVLREKKENNIKIHTLQILLKITCYKELLLKYNVGTSYPTIKDDDILNLLIPIIDSSIQSQIETKIKESFRLKEKSKQLLDIAKRAVEIAIEKDEDEAIKFLENRDG